MNVYDFDGTIYDGDSCRDIVKYGLRKHPILTLQSLFGALNKYIKYKRGLVPFEEVKEKLLSFIFKIKNYNKFIDGFVNDHARKIKKWYFKRKDTNDVIVSASYELWLVKFARKIGIKHVIGTKTNKDGKIIGKNCKHKEKVIRFRKLFPHKKIESSYTDSSVDIPILEIAQKSYVVEGNDLKPYKKGYQFKNN